MYVCMYVCMYTYIYARVYLSSYFAELFSVPRFGTERKRANARVNVNTTEYPRYFRHRPIDYV